MIRIDLAEVLVSPRLHNKGLQNTAISPLVYGSAIWAGLAGTCGLGPLLTEPHLHTGKEQASPSPLGPPRATLAW